MLSNCDQGKCMFELDFAKCARGHLTPLQPSTPQSTEEYRRSIEMGDVPRFVACMRCNRVYKALSLYAQTSTTGLLPYHPQAQIAVFVETIVCDDIEHAFRVSITGVRNVDTTVTDAMQEWRWEDGDRKCPDGHQISLPPYWDELRKD